jgi:hypothetical protein
MGGAGQHADIGAGAEHARLTGTEHDDAHLRVLEAQPLEYVGEFDIDAEIVGIELKVVAFEQAALFVDIHGQRGRVAIGRQLPMPIARRVGRKIDPRGAVRQCAFLVRHSVRPGFLAGRAAARYAL